MKIEADVEGLLKLISSAIETYTTAFFLAYNKRRVLKLWRFYSLSENVISDSTIPFGYGPIGRVAEDEKSFDLSKFSDRDSSMLGLYSKSEEIKSFAAVPVIRDNKLDGVLCVDSKSAFVFTNKDQKLLTLFADQLADLVNNIKVSELIETESSDIEFLYDFNKKLGSADKVVDILQLVFHSIMQRLKCGDCFLSLRTDEDILNESEKFCVELVYNHQSLKNVIFSDQDGLAGCVIRGREPFLLASRKEDFGSYIFVPSKPVGRFKSFIGAPLLANNEVSGLICATDGREGYFNQRDLQVVSIMANSVSLAMSNLKAREKANSLLNFIDGLTGLYNYSEFQERLEKAFQDAEQRRRPLSLMIMDIDDFKSLNSLLGYKVGNEVLKRFAQILLSLISDDSILASRYGPDEFSLILPSITREQAITIADRIRRATEDPTFISPSYGVHISVSIGISSLSQDTGSCNDLVANALRSLSTAKSSGGGKAIY